VAAKTAFDQSPDGEHCLGSFRRGPANFTLVRTSAATDVPSTYRIDCDDGVGPREVCRFEESPAAPPVWRGAWNGDEWCDWIMAKVGVLIRQPDRREL